MARNIPWWAGAILIAVLWLIARPYRGVRHDGVLYLGQTLGHLMPDTIGRDLFLAYGSQDRYSIFSAVMGPLVSWLGVGTSQIAVLLLSEVVFVLACWALLAELPRKMRWLALLAVVALPHTYGGDGIFAFAEPFLSARSLAEPLALVSLALFLRGRAAWSLVAMLGAAIAHPLVALPAIAIAWIALCLKDRRWAWVAVVVVLAAAAGLMGLAPFAALWQRYDPAWWAVVREVNTHVLLSSATNVDWAATALDIALLGLSLRVLAEGPLARMVRALLGCTVVSCVIWGVGTDLLHDVLLTQLQLWRIFWLTHLLATLLLPLPLLALWRRGGVGQWAAAALVLSVVAVGGTLQTCWLCVAWTLLSLVVLRARTPVSPKVVRLAVLASGLATVVVTAFVGFSTWGASVAAPDRFNGASGLQIGLGLTVVTAAIGVGVMRGLEGTGHRRLAAFVVLLGLAGCSLCWWDQRSEWQRFVESGLQRSQQPFEGKLAPGASVYWEQSLLDPWLLIHRPQFFDQQQGSGALFNRSNAMAFEARKSVMAPLLVRKAICNTVASLTGADPSDPDTCAPDADAMEELCGQVVRPDFLVVRTGPNGGATGANATWTFRASDPRLSRTYRLYACPRQR